MKSYVARRLLLMIMSVCLTSVIVFTLIDSSSHQFLENELEKKYLAAEGTMDFKSMEILKKQLDDKYRLNLPVFYFSIIPKNLPDTVRFIQPKSDRLLIEKLIKTYGQPELVLRFYHQVKTLPHHKSGKKNIVKVLLNADDEASLFNAVLQNDIPPEIFLSIKKSRGNINWFIPSFRWNGFNNRYHHWIKGVAIGNLGRSLSDNIPVVNRFIPSLLTSITITISAIIILFITTIPMGIYFSRVSDQRKSIFFQFMYAINAMPLYWIGILLVMFLASPIFLQVFPAYGLGQSNGFWEYLYHIFLPITCIIISAFPYLFSQVHAAFETQLQKDYTRTAKAKGLTFRLIFFKHIFKNAIPPIITIFAALIPISVAGTITIEVIFSLPGTGKLLVDAVLGQDYPIILPIVLSAVIVKIISQLVADLGIFIADPRISDI